MRGLTSKRSRYVGDISPQLFSPWKQALGALTLFAACGITDGEPCGQDKPCFGPNKRAEKGQVLVYNNAEEPQTIDPGLATGTPDGRIIDELFEGLTDYHPKTLQPIPGVAESYEESADHKHFIFHLRKSAKWTNGETVTAHDFVYSWERVLNSATGAQYATILYFFKNAEQYLNETVRVVQANVNATNETPGDGLALTAGQVVTIEDSNAARVKGDDVKLASSPGAAQSGASLESDQVVIIRTRQSLAKIGGTPDEKEVWLDVEAYNINLESPAEIKNFKEPSTKAERGWVKASQVSSFMPSSNRRIMANQELLRKKPQGDSVKLIENRADAIIPAGDEVRIMFIEGEYAKVYWQGKSRYGYIKLTSLLNPWGGLYQFKVKVQVDEEQTPKTPPPPLPEPVSAPTSSSAPTATSAPSSEPAASQPSSAPVVVPAPKPAAVGSGWVYAQDLLLDPKVLGFRAIDDSTLEVTLKSPTTYFLTLLAHYSYRPVHPETFEEWGLEWTKPEHIVGNGPFKLELHQMRDRFELVRSPTYWGKESVTLDRVIAYSMNDQNTTLMMYKAGYTDLVVANDMPNTYIPVFYDYEKATPKMADFGVSPSLGTYFYRLNTQKPPFDNPKVRKALAMGIDRSKIPKATQVPFQPADSITPPGIPESGYNPPDGPQFNIAEAKKLLAEAGYPDGKGFPPVSILFNTQDQHKHIAELVQAQWKDNLNVNATLKNTEWKTYLDSMQSLNYQIARAGWIGDFLDPMTFLDMWSTGNGNNNTGWGKKEYDDMILEAQNETDVVKRRQIMAKMETMLNDEMPFIPLYTYVWFALTKPYIKNYYDNMQDKHPLKWVCIETQMLGETTAPVCTEAEKRLENEKGFSK
jgi:ABC-type oligopeptide transport system substrate-binding subunit